jgi:hypothetical protein
MTKAATRAQRRRRGKTIRLSGGQSAQPRATQGRRTDLDPDPVDRVALTARARRTGCTVEDARDILAGDDMGRCIRAMRPGNEDRRALLTVWQGISAAWHNYAARCLSLPTGAQGVSIPMLPEPMQTDPSLRVDLRTADERDEAARRVWFDRLEAIMTLPPDQRHALRGHLHGYGAALWCTDTIRPTRHGALAVAALASLHRAQGT